MSDHSIEDLEQLVQDFVFSPVGEDLKSTSKSKPKKEPAKFKNIKKTEDDNVETNTYTKKYSEAFGWDKDALKGLEDFDIIMYKDEYWDADDLKHIPNKDKFDGRVIDHSAMYPFVLAQQPQFKGMKTMLVGPTGSGKSTLAEFYGATVNQPFLRINGRQDMESDSIIGRPWVTPTGMEFLLGEWPKATQKGWLTLIDEPWKMPPGIWMTAQRHLERGGIWQLDDIPGDNVLDKQIVPKSSYRCVLADNVVGTGDNVDKYAATMIQDSSTLNRIDIVIKVPYLKPKDEVGIVLHKYPQIAPHMAERMIALLNLLRTGYDSGELSSPASIRNIEAWSELAIKIKDYGKAFEWVMINRYADDDEQGAVRNHYMTCFKEAL